MLVEPTKFCPAKIQLFIETANPQPTIFQLPKHRTKTPIEKQCSAVKFGTTPRATVLKTTQLPITQNLRTKKC